jgi:hypothetical protein
LAKYGKVRELEVGSFGEWSDNVETLVKVCASRIAHFTWQEAGYRNEQDACEILKTFCFKKLAILSLHEIAVLLRNRANQIGSVTKRRENIINNTTQRYI